MQKNRTNKGNRTFDSVVSERVVFILDSVVFCLSVCLFGWVGWLIGLLVDLFGLFLCFGLAWFDLFWFGAVC